MSAGRSSAKPEPEFDAYAASYDAALAEGLSASGEDKNYFARGRVAWLKRRLDQAGFNAQSVLDFGCGTGSSAPFLKELLGRPAIVGVDVSENSIREARRLHASEWTEFATLAERKPDGTFDLAFCNGVFHHIPVEQRAAAVNYVKASLRPGGLFALWENNPWNPGTRYVMSRIPFDRDAVTLTPPQGRQLVREAGFEILRTDFLFIFPRKLGWLRWLESRLARWPLGGQYQILCRKPR